MRSRTDQPQGQVLYANFNEEQQCSWVCAHLVGKLVANK